MENLQTELPQTKVHHTSPYLVAEMDQHTPSTSYQKKTEEIDKTLTLLRKCSKGTTTPCTCQTYPYYHAILTAEAHCDEIYKQLNGANKKDKCPHLNCLEKWNYKRNHLITATILTTTILTLATVTSLVIWNLMT